MKKDNKSYIFKHLHSTATYFDSYNSLSFEIIYKVNSKFDLKIKEALIIDWTKRNLKRAAKPFSSHTFTIVSTTPLFLSVFVFFSFLFHVMFSLSLKLIISIFYYLNCTSLLIHLITNILYHTFLFDLLFSLYPTLIMRIFCCLNYTSLLLDLIITYLVNTFYNNYAIKIGPRQLL